MCYYVLYYYIVNTDITICRQHIAVVAAQELDFVHCQLFYFSVFFHKDKSETINGAKRGKTKFYGINPHSCIQPFFLLSLLFVKY